MLKDWDYYELGRLLNVHGSFNYMWYLYFTDISRSVNVSLLRFVANIIAYSHVSAVFLPLSATKC